MKKTSQIKALETPRTRRRSLRVADPGTEIRRGRKRSEVRGPKTPGPALAEDASTGTGPAVEGTPGQSGIRLTTVEGKRFPIVGIGASAGGLEAMTQFVRHLPNDTGMAYVLVQHLDPTHESALTSLLSRSTSIRVTEARNNLGLEPDHLYIIPPNTIMRIEERRLKLLPRKDGKGTHAPIDYFFRSLAQQEGSSSVGIILSGNGSDGTLGLQAIKAAGGITFAQDEGSAKYPNMPASAGAARCVDFILPPEDIARELARIGDHPYVSSHESPPRQHPLTEDRAFEDILATLRQRTGVDFSHYKHATLERRMQRRMVLHKFERLKDYAAYVHTDPAEARELFHEVLIHVTRFFRDPGIFNTLKRRIFPRLVKGKTHHHPIRIWVPGCSTGEEVYSIAMSLFESLKDRQAVPPVQLFGTDINDLALDKARAGIYPECIREDVSAERLRRFFVRHEGGYRINKSIRELCIFARQNLVADPPFSNLDLISCRNVLIYLGPPLQRKVMPVFHYALKSTGLLLLGVSETVGSFAEFFELTDKKNKIYTKKTTHLRQALRLGQFHPHPATPKGEAPGKPADLSANVADIQKQADRILLSHFGPPGVIIDDQMEVIQFRGRTGDYFEHRHGEANLNLLRMAREGLAMELRAAVSKAIKQNTRVRQDGARVKQNGGFIDVSVEVVPFQVPPSPEKFYLVLLDMPVPPVPAPGRRSTRERKARGSHSETEIDQLREELASTRESLQAIIEEQEATNEELRSANEEIMSSVEELQSTNEELETAKEELQSTNEELTTLNEELETRNTEMTHVNNDLHNIMSSVSIPMLILGRDLRIRRFTPTAEKHFNLIASDVGRPITDIALKIDLPDLERVIVGVIDSLESRDIEARDRDGHYWSVRVRPYKTTDNKIEGAIVAVVDMNGIRNSSQQIERDRPG